MPGKSSRDRAAVVAQPSAEPSGYPDSRSHLNDHLRRIEQLIRAQVLRWRAGVAASKPEHSWGMIQVTDAEVQAFLQAAPGAPEEYSDEAKAAIEARWTEALEMSSRISKAEKGTASTVPLRLLRLQQIFHLSDEDRDVILVCLLPELDGRFRRLYGFLQDDASKSEPTAELVAAILSRRDNRLADLRTHLAPSGSLLTQGLVIVNSGQDPFPVRLLRVEDRIISFLLDGDAADPRIREFVSEIDPLQLDQLIADEKYVERLRDLAEWYRSGQVTGCAVFLHGIYGSGRLSTACALATATNRRLLRIDSVQAFRSPVPWEEVLRLAFREARLRDAALYWPDCDALLTSDQSAKGWDALVRAAEAFPGLVLFGSESAWNPVGSFRKTPFLRVDVPMPSHAVRCRLWAAHLPESAHFVQPTPAGDVLADALANRFQLTEGQILDAIGAAQSQAIARNPKAPLLTAEDLYDGCRRQSSRRLLTFTKRIEPRADIQFSDLILPPATLRQLREVQHRIRTMHRVYSELGFENRLRLGRGMVILFTGSSGTGKTMAAEWLARELGVDLHKADLSSVVSKWVGETEKNLHQLFGEAEGSSAIIFFDEADALFGKRGEVKDARDRWANTEVNFLLQRIEEYAGVVILASNLKQNIDEAFLRRISAMVEFPAPDEASRALIWRGMFPKGLGRPSDEEIQSLASKVRMAGGSVRNIVLDAVFRAVSDDVQKEPVVTIRHLVLATAREYQKQGRPITKAELGDVFYQWIEEEIL